MLLACYVPYFLVPLVMTLDMAARVKSLMAAAVRVEAERKRR
jgi:hypothetical protein